MFFKTLSTSFDSSGFLLVKIFFFFCSFLSQSLNNFPPPYLVRLFCPSFLFILHAFLHFHQIFWTKEILGFLVILGVLIKFIEWVFVHASYKHVSSTLISKFSWFVQNFKIRVYMFLRNLEILFNWVKLIEIDLWYSLIEWL